MFRGEWSAAGGRWLRAMLWLVVAGYGAYVVSTYQAGYTAAANGERPLYTDFTPTYAAALVLRELPADFVYLPRAMDEAARETARIIYGDGLSDEQVRALPFTPWLYPPTFNVILEPLARLPYLGALGLWFALTLPPYLLAMRRMLPAGWAWPCMLAMPPVFLNVMYGQTGFLSAGLLALGLLAIRRAPVAAGVLIGLASLKPHLGILFPVALAAAGQWRVFAAAAGTVLALVGLSLLAYGVEPWIAYWAMAGFHLDGFAAHAYNFVPMVSVLATLKTLGLPLPYAWGAQAVAAVLMALLVGAVWRSGRRRCDTFGLQAAILLLATVLAVPMVYLYDLVLLVPVAVWLWGDVCRGGDRRLAAFVLAGGMLILLPAKQLAAAGLPVGGWVALAWLLLAVYQFRRRLAAAMPVSDDPACRAGV